MSTWTHRSPTKPGFYWMKALWKTANADWPNYLTPQVVRVYEDEDNNRLMWVGTADNENTIEGPSRPDVLWQGPIEPEPIL